MRAAHAGSPIDADAITVRRLEIEAARRKRLAGGRHGKLRHTVQICGFRFGEERYRLPVHQRTDLRAGTESDRLREAADAGASLAQRAAEVFYGVTER
jgi:hypothetical protein